MISLDLLREQFNGRVELRERRPGVYQLIAPMYHEDGDMVDVYLEETGNGLIRVCDHAMTLMRLSYSFDLDTPNKEKIFQRILAENRVSEDKGNLFLDARRESLYPAVLQFAQALLKVSNMRLYKRAVIQSLFYEMLEEYVTTQLGQYSPKASVCPLANRDDLEVDYALLVAGRATYLFGVRDTAKARLVTISCLQFQLAKLAFTSMAVHEDFDSLTSKDRSRITSAVDKQFPSLDDLQQNARAFLEREASRPA